jgi:hypothetical protein
VSRARRPDPVHPGHEPAWGPSGPSHKAAGLLRTALPPPPLACAPRPTLRLAPIKPGCLVPRALAIGTPCPCCVASLRELRRRRCHGAELVAGPSSIRRRGDRLEENGTTRSFTGSRRTYSTCSLDRRTTGAPPPLEAEPPATPSSAAGRIPAAPPRPCRRWASPRDPLRLLSVFPFSPELLGRRVAGDWSHQSRRPSLSRGRGWLCRFVFRPLEYLVIFIFSYVSCRSCVKSPRSVRFLQPSRTRHLL